MEPLPLIVPERFADVYTPSGLDSPDTTSSLTTARQAGSSSSFPPLAMRTEAHGLMPLVPLMFKTDVAPSTTMFVPPQ